MRSRRFRVDAGARFGVFLSAMSSEETIRSELLARFARLEAHLKLFNAEFREVKALLGSAQLASPPALNPEPQSASCVPAAASPSAPAPVAVNGEAAPVPPPAAVAAPVIPTAPPVPDDPRVRKSRKRGWLMARIEPRTRPGLLTGAGSPPGNPFRRLPDECPAPCGGAQP